MSKYLIEWGFLTLFLLDLSTFIDILLLIFFEMHQFQSVPRDILYKRDTHKFEAWSQVSVLLKVISKSRNKLKKMF